MAWAINQLSAREPKLRGDLLDAGATLRETQERLVAGEAERADLREASEREQTALSRALDAIGSVAGGAGAELSSAAVERARQTLHAVALDEGVRRDFERHRLTTEHDPAGLGGFTLGGAVASRKGGGKARAAEDDERRVAKRRRDELKGAEATVRKLDQRVQEAQRDVEATRKDAEQAQRKLERATQALEKAASDAATARERVRELRARPK